jgi:hypothetical protein
MFDYIGMFVYTLPIELGASASMAGSLAIPLEVLTQACQRHLLLRLCAF